MNTILAFFAVVFLSEFWRETVQWLKQLLYEF